MWEWVKTCDFLWEKGDEHPATHQQFFAVFTSNAPGLGLVNCHLEGLKAPCLLNIPKMKGRHFETCINGHKLRTSKMETKIHHDWSNKTRNHTMKIVDFRKQHRFYPGKIEAITELSNIKKHSIISSIQREERDAVSRWRRWSNSWLWRCRTRFDGTTSFFVLSRGSYW